MSPKPGSDIDLDVVLRPLLVESLYSDDDLIHLAALLRRQLRHFYKADMSDYVRLIVHVLATPAQCLYGATVTHLFHPAMADPYGARSGASMQAVKAVSFLVAPSTARRCKKR